MGLYSGFPIFWSRERIPPRFYQMGHLCFLSWGLSEGYLESRSVTVPILVLKWMLFALLVGCLLCSGLPPKVDIEAPIEVDYCGGLLHSERVVLPKKG